jgi:hypothetical protein
LVVSILYAEVEERRGNKGKLSCKLTTNLDIKIKKLREEVKVA